jgi:hypothetical protein
LVRHTETALHHHYEQVRIHQAGSMVIEEFWSWLEGRDRVDEDISAQCTLSMMRPHKDRR